MNVWSPKIEQTNEFSLSQIWILGGTFGEDLNSIEAGWQVYELFLIIDFFLEIWLKDFDYLSKFLFVLLNRLALICMEITILDFSLIGL